MTIRNSGESDYWKDRYSQLLDELEQRKADWQDAERLLTRVIGRITSATIGLAPIIDPQLQSIRELSKTGLLTDSARGQLDEVCDALARIGKYSSRNGKSVSVPSVICDISIFSFLQSYMESDGECAALSALRERAERREFPDESSLYAALERHLQAVVDARAAQRREARGIRPGLLSRLLGKQTSTDGGQVDLTAIRRKLASLLDTIDIPIALHGQANLLRERIERDADAAQLLILFQQAIDFLIQVRAKTQQEQQSFETFLNDLTGVLLELESRTLGIQALTKAAGSGALGLHNSFSADVESLRTTTNAATDLAGLKQVLSARLESIAVRLAEEREKESLRARDTEAQVAQMASRLQELESETGELRTRIRVEHNLAMRDALTGLPNRAAFEEYLVKEIARCKRFKQPFYMLIWDIDHFKGINDRFGHRAGDKALVVIAQTLSSSIRETDFCGRFGGEEFVMILTGTEEQSALRVADDIRAKVENCGFNSLGKPVQITVSCGISRYLPDEPPDQTFERADKALYRAKNEGRNRCVVG